MSRMLHFFEHSWDLARRAALAGQLELALKHLQPLLSVPEVPPYLRRSARRLVARLYVASSEYRRARQQLRLALQESPRQADCAYELGLAWERDPAGRMVTAKRWYRRAFAWRRCSKHAVALARLELWAGAPKRAYHFLKRACELGLGDAASAQAALELCCHAGWYRLGRKLTQETRFAWHQSSWWPGLAARFHVQAQPTAQELGSQFSEGSALLAIPPRATRPRLRANRPGTKSILAFRTIPGSISGSPVAEGFSGGLTIPSGATATTGDTSTTIGSTPAASLGSQVGTQPGSRSPAALRPSRPRQLPTTEGSGFRTDTIRPPRPRLWTFRA